MTRTRRHRGVGRRIVVIATRIEIEIGHAAATLAMMMTTTTSRAHDAGRTTTTRATDPTREEAGHHGASQTVTMSVATATIVDIGPIMAMGNPAAAGTTTVTTTGGQTGGTRMEETEIATGTGIETATLATDTIRTETGTRETGRERRKGSASRRKTLGGMPRWGRSTTRPLRRSWVVWPRCILITGSS